MCSSIDESRFLPETEIYNITRENDFNFFKLETLAPITNDVRFDRRNIRGSRFLLHIYHESFHTRVLKEYIFTCFFCTHCSSHHCIVTTIIRIRVKTEEMIYRCAEEVVKRLSIHDRNKQATLDETPSARRICVFIHCRLAARPRNNYTYEIRSSPTATKVDKETTVDKRD